MNEVTAALLDAARSHVPSEAEKREHAISFAFGNCSLENPKITREMIEREYDKLHPFVMLTIPKEIWDVLPMEQRAIPRFAMKMISLGGSDGSVYIQVTEERAAEILGWMRELDGTDEPAL